MTAQTCRTCQLLIKTGGYRGRKAERSCVKRVFLFAPLATWKPAANCKYYQPKRQRR